MIAAFPCAGTKRPSYFVCINIHPFSLINLKTTTRGLKIQQKNLLGVTKSFEAIALSLHVASS